MEVFALPGFLPNSKLELFEAALQGISFPAFSACRCVLQYDLAQIFSNQALPNIAVIEALAAQAAQ
jgi:hypothetical protein